MTFEAGDLVLVPFPYTDLTATKRRPALVLSRGEYNRAGPDIIVCAVTSRVDNTANSVLIDPSDVEEGSLPCTSRVKVGKVASLARSVVIRRMGRVDASTLRRVVREFRALFPD